MSNEPKNASRKAIWFFLTRLPRLLCGHGCGAIQFGLRDQLAFSESGTKFHFWTSRKKGSCQITMQMFRYKKTTDLNHMFIINEPISFHDFLELAAIQDLEKTSDGLTKPLPFGFCLFHVHSAAWFGVVIGAHPKIWEFWFGSNFLVLS